MHSKYKDTFKALSVNATGQILREYVDELIDELGSVDTMSNDPVETRQKTLQILRTKLLDPLTHKQSKPQKVETYE